MITQPAAGQGVKVPLSPQVPTGQLLPVRQGEKYQFAGLYVGVDNNSVDAEVGLVLRQHSGDIRSGRLFY